MKILLIAYDNDKHISNFPLGIAYLAASLKDKGYYVKIYNQDVYHYSEKHLNNYLNQEKFDLIGIGACGGYYQYNKVLKLCEAVHNSKYSPLLLLGGHLPSPEPEYFLRKTYADIVVRGEGEETILELVKAIENNRDLQTVNGIAFLKENHLVLTDERLPIKDIDNIPYPAWEMFPINHYALYRYPNVKNSERSMPVLSGRGCPFKCNFCYRMDEGFRPRSVESIIEEINILKKDYYISHIAFRDELLMSSEKRVLELCEGFINSRLNIKWDCNGRLNYATPEVLKAMKKSGCIFINYGIESLDEKALDNMNKKLTEKQIIDGIENTLNAGISPGFNIIFGNIGETKYSLQKGVDFLLKYDDHSQLRTIKPVTPYPGCDLYYYAIEKGLIKNCQDFYENKHKNSDLLTVNFTEMTDKEFYQALYEANLKLLDNYTSNMYKKNKKTLDKLYFEKDVNFRGFRH